MQPLRPSPQPNVRPTPGKAGPTAPQNVGPLGGIVFSAVCLAAYVAVVIAAML